MTASEMRVYCDSSALIKRATQEAESDSVESALDAYAAAGAVIASSSLARVEVSRGLRSAFAGRVGGPRPDDLRYSDADINAAADDALSGVSERLITDEVIALARRVAPPRLRTLDAIHLATALLLDVQVVMAYDNRLIDACRHHGLSVTRPGID